MRLASIHTYPVKGCHRVDQIRAAVEPWGLRGDRRWLVVDADSGRFVSQREHAGLARLRPELTAAGLVLRTSDMPDLAVPEPHDSEPMEVTVWRFSGRAATAGKEADEWLSSALARKVRLVWLDDPRRRPVNTQYGKPGDTVSFADGYPLLLANTASLDVLNEWIAESGSIEGPLPMARFRPNVVVSGAQPWAEDGWIGTRLRIGDVTFRAPKPCERCLVTTTDQETGERGREPLRALARHRNVDRTLLFAINLIPDGPGEIAVGDPITVR
jgi:uncharacterized protein YcbX